MTRISLMNLMLHGLSSPRFFYADALSKDFAEERAYDIVLANPPFKGAIDAANVTPPLPAKVKKTEILFLHLFLRLLDNGGRAAVIVPDGVLFGSSNAHKEVRRALIEDNRLDGVVSMPSGVFRPTPASRPPSCSSPREPPPSVSGSTTWSTTASPSTTGASASPTTTSPTSSNAGSGATMLAS
jgi:type I restriction-modification system DNA methylase subunit